MSAANTNGQYTNTRPRPKPIDFEAAAAHHDGSPDDKSKTKEPRLSPRLGASLTESIARARARSEGQEKPISVYLPILADHFGGGLWPGLHVINSGTGAGKTQSVVGQALHTAKAGIPVLYIGLELGQFEIDLRVLGLEANVPWSHLWVGKATAENLTAVEGVAAALGN